MEFTKLYQKAVEVLNPRQVSESLEAGGVAAALVTDKGNVYRGVLQTIYLRSVGRS